MKHFLSFLKLLLNEAISEMKIGFKRACISVSNQLTDRWFRHTLHHKGGDARMTEEVSMQRETRLCGVVFDGMLQSIHRKRTATSDTFKSYKDLINLRKKVTTFLIQIFVESCKCVTIHIN